MKIPRLGFYAWLVVAVTAAVCVTLVHAFLVPAIVLDADPVPLSLGWLATWMSVVLAVSTVLVLVVRERARTSLRLEDFPGKQTIVVTTHDNRFGALESLAAEFSAEGYPVFYAADTGTNLARIHRVLCRHGLVCWTSSEESNMPWARFKTIASVNISLDNATHFEHVYEILQRYLSTRTVTALVLVCGDRSIGLDSTSVEKTDAQGLGDYLLTR